jgi:HlyD family secretion protein
MKALMGMAAVIGTRAPGFVKSIVRKGRSPGAWGDAGVPFRRVPVSAANRTDGDAGSSDGAVRCAHHTLRSVGAPLWRDRIAGGLRAGLVLAGIWAMSACTQAPDQGYPGYLEADYAYIGVPVAGRLESLSARRGTGVESGDALFALDGELEALQVREAEARLAEAQARRDDLSIGRRPEEIRVIAERVREARSAAALAGTELERARELHGRGLLAADALDRARAAEQQARARLASLTAEQQSADLAGRPDAIAAADAAVAAAAALLDQARWRGQQSVARAASAAEVVETYFEPGEWVPAGSPVLKLLPVGALHVRFYVPLAERAQWQAGQDVAVRCSGCPQALRATVRLIAPGPEYTPPVIYSESRSEDLVFRVEAELIDHAPLAPGLPASVERFVP